MRPGLVGVGIAFLAVAAVSGSSLALWPSSPSTRTVTTEVPLTFSGPNQTREALLTGTSSPSGTFTVVWQSSAAFDVALYDVPGCASPSLACERSPAVIQWLDNASGHYSAQGALSFPYLLVWTPRSPSAGSLQATAESEAELSTAPPTWATLATVGALGSLGVVGGVALFLGLFLRGGLYRRSGSNSTGTEPGPPSGRDVSVTAPRTDPLDGEAGRPPRAPPSPGR